MELALVGPSVSTENTIARAEKIYEFLVKVPSASSNESSLEWRLSAALHAMRQARDTIRDGNNYHVYVLLDNTIRKLDNLDC
jgi:hypothetical protein